MDSTLQNFLNFLSLVDQVIDESEFDVDTTIVATVQDGISADNTDTKLDTAISAASNYLTELLTDNEGSSEGDDSNDEDDTESPF